MTNFSTGETHQRVIERWHMIGHQSGVVPAVQPPQTAQAATPPTGDRRKLH